ncbi:MAG: hypothetical protein KBS76_00760, partial [Ruminococcus sp.]|nr:hypothetical protein [Candidatus Apopatosoma intestinale]
MEKLQKQKRNIRWPLVRHDLFIYTVSELFFLTFGSTAKGFGFSEMAALYAVGLLCVFIARFLLNVYGQILRYGGVQIF